MTTFERSLDKNFMEALRREADRDGWWRDVLNDGKLVIATRGTYLNVYWQGLALFTVTCLGGTLRVTTHEKFLLDPALKRQVELGADGRFAVAALLQRALTEEYKGHSTLAKLRTAAGLYAGEEKVGCHEIAVRSPSVIDVEVAFSQKQYPADDLLRKIPRIDLAAVEPDARLVFWEAKTYNNKELRTSEGGPAPVCQQIAEYRTVIGQHREALEASYAGVAANLVAFAGMGWKRKLSPLIMDVGTGKMKLRLGDEPKVGLIVFGYDAGQRDAAHWKAHRDKLEEYVGKPKFSGEAKDVQL